MFDGDDTNPTFQRFWPEVKRLFSKNTKGFEVLINNLEAPESIQLVDLGAGTSLTLIDFADKTDFLKMCEEHEAKVTFFFTLAPSVDSVGLLKRLSEQFTDRVDYVVARSEAIPGSWDLWETSNTRKTVLEKYHAIEISVPALDGDAFSAVDRLTNNKDRLTWAAAAEMKEVPLVSRAYVGRWLEKTFAQYEKVKSYLMP